MGSDSQILISLDLYFYNILGGWSPAPEGWIFSLLISTVNLLNYVLRSSSYMYKGRISKI